MKPDQLANLHVAKKQLHLEETDYRLILRNVGGVASSKDLTNPAFEQVMAFFEERGFRQSNQPEDYWRKKYCAQDRFCGERMVQRIHELSQQVKYSLIGLIVKVSNGRTEKPELLTPQEANKLVEMMKAIARRGDPRGRPLPDARPLPAVRPPSPDQGLFGAIPPPLAPSPLRPLAPSPPPAPAPAILGPEYDEEPPF